jgi:hypothetical protein
MKRTFATQGTSLIALFVLLFGLFLTANTAGAQSLSGSSSNINWKSKSEVMTIAKAQVEFWHQQGPQGPGTAAYNNQVRHAAYYKEIFASLERGETVPEAVESSLTAAAMLGGEQEFAFTSKTVLLAIKEEATQLFQ